VVVTDSASASITALVTAVDTADSAPALVQAVRSLAMAQQPEAIPTLITVLGFNNPGAAVAAVDGLVQLGAAAVPALLEQLDGYNYGARAWAIRALALIGDPRALAVLVETARGDFALSVRRAAAKGLGTLRWSELPSEQVFAAQEDAQSALLMALVDPEWVVRYGGVVGLSGLLAARPLQDRSAGLTALQQRLETETDITVRARIQRALTDLAAVA
jgi:phycocyanobilin lyase beta subunit